MRGTVPERQADKGTPGVGVGMRAALADQIGQEQQPLRPGRHLLGLGGHRLEAHLAVAEGGQRLPEPGEGAAGIHRDPHAMPAAGRVVAEDLQPAARIGRAGVERTSRDPGRADDGLGDARIDEAAAGRLDHRVTAAADHRQAARQPKPVGQIVAQPAGHLVRFVSARHHRCRDLDALEQGLAPLPPGHVEEPGAGGLGDLGGMLAGEQQPNVVLGVQEALEPRVALGLLVAQPDDLAAGIADQHRVVGHAQETVEPTRPLGDPGTLPGVALVVPQDCRADDLVAGIERHQPVHLPRKADPEDLERVADALPHGRKPLFHGTPPIGRVLLGPAGPGRAQGVARGMLRQDDATAIDDQHLGRRGPDIDPDQALRGARHPASPSSLQCCLAGAGRAPATP